MADISKITLPNGSSYDIKDATARSEKQNIRNGTISGAVDWNTLTTAGTYKIQKTTMTADYNAPVGEYAYGILVVFDSDGGIEKRIMQIYFPHSPSKNYMYIRMRNSDVWTDWKGLSKDADTAKNLSSFTIPYNRPVANGGNGKQWIKFAEVVDEGITTTNRWYGKALEFEIFNNGYGSNGNFVSMGRVSLCVSVHNQKTFTKEAITIKWQNCKPNAYTINHIVAVVTDTKVEFFVLNDVWDTALTFVITRDIGIAYGSTYTSTQYTSADFATYYSDKKIIEGSLDTNLYIYNSIKVNNHTVETDVPANAKFTDTVYTLPAATSSTLGGVKIGSNITNSSGTISLTKANVTAALGYTPPTTNTTYDVATQSANGLMSSSDKTKLDGIATGANKTTVDSALSSTSTNPVQNKVIHSALAGKAAASHTHTTQSAEATSDANASYLRQIATGTAAATTTNCPNGCLYGQYS